MIIVVVDFLNPKVLPHGGSFWVEALAKYSRNFFFAVVGTFKDWIL